MIQILVQIQYICMSGIEKLIVSGKDVLQFIRCLVVVFRVFPRNTIAYGTFPRGKYLIRDIGIPVRYRLLLHDISAMLFL